jgi:hypothetical protein
VPGASPYKAVEAFLAPLERAVACLGTGKIVVSPGGRATTGKTHVWSLNGGDGLVLRGDAAGCRFLASMHYRIIPTDSEKYDILEGRWRVTTSAYLYEFRATDNAKLWAMHWHPAGKSHATFPHLPTPRQTLESAVQWCIEMGAEPQQRWGKGGPQAHPAGTRSALPAAGAVGETPAGVGAGAVVRAASKAIAAAA